MTHIILSGTRAPGTSPTPSPLTAGGQRMGSTFWCDNEFHSRAKHRKAAGKSVFEHDAAMRRRPQSQRKVHDNMNPSGVGVRESRDSGNHPESRAVGVMFDVTGSMQGVPRILQ